MIDGRPRTVSAPAKINICLDVRWRRPDGYHELDTVFQRLELHDRIVLQPGGRDLRLICDRPELPVGSKNLAFRAAELIRREYGVDYGVLIRLQKRIPIAAGLGGGSADAAAVLRELPAVWELPPLPRERLLMLAGSLGADVPFCAQDSPTARAGGIGELLQALPSFAGIEVLLVKPAARLSTRAVYERLNLAEAVHPDIEAAVRAMASRDLQALQLAAGNVLERPAVELVPEIAAVKETLKKAGAGMVLMTGSGPTVFALAGKRGWALRAARLIARPDWIAIPTRTAGPA